MNLVHLHFIFVELLSIFRFFFPVILCRRFFFRAAATVDKAQALTVELSLKPGVGRILGAHALISGASVPLLPNGSIHIDIKAGDVEVLGILSQDPTPSSEVDIQTLLV